MWQAWIMRYNAITRVRPNALKEGLKQLGLWNLKSEHKHIPPQYFEADLDVRLSLLRGLLDTDGWVESFGAVRFSSTSHRLAVDVANPHAFGRTGDFVSDLALRPEDLAPFETILNSMQKDYSEDFRTGFIAESPQKLRRIRQHLGVGECGGRA